MSNGENISRKSDLEMSYRRKAKAQYKPWRPKKVKAFTRVSGKKPRTGTPRKRSRGKSSFSKAEGPLRISDDEAFRREEKSFERLKRKCLSDERYKGKFIAVLGGKIVDVDDDDCRLAKRVYDRFGYRPVYIGKVTETRRIVEIPSPMLEMPEND